MVENTSSLSDSQLFSLLTDSADAAMLIAKAEDYAIVHANTFGKSAYKLGQTVPDTFHRLFSQSVIKALDHLVSQYPSKQVVTVEDPLPTPDGTTIPGEMTFSMHGVGENIFIVCVARSLEHRTSRFGSLPQTTQELSGMLKEQDTLLSHMGDFLYKHNVAGVFTYLSPSVHTVTGYSPDEFTQNSSRFFTDHPLNRHRSKYIEQVLNGNHVAPYLVEIFHKKGHRIMLEISERPHFEENKVVGCVGVARDVTDRMEILQEAQRLRGTLENVVNAMPSIIIAVDADMNIAQWNTHAQKAYGKHYKEVIGSALPIVCPHLGYLSKPLRECIMSHSPNALPRQTRTSEDRVIHEQTTIFPLPRDGSGNPIGAVIRIDDITEQVHMEQMMVQTEKMMSIGGLAAGMAHEINNPLGGILQALQNVQRRVSHDLPANAQTAEELGCSLDILRTYLDQRGIFRMLDGVKDSAIKASEIVTNMLTFSRKSDPQHREQDINLLVNNTIELASTEYDLKKNYDFNHVTLHRELADTLPPVMCNHTEIEQVIFNLLRNAAQAMDPANNPTLILRTRHEPENPQNELPCEHVVIEVEDNGPGIPPEAMERIFEPFYTTKEAGVGTGLGLSVSYFIITENHKGRLSATSIVGKGTTFTICLPAAAAACIQKKRPD